MESGTRFNLADAIKNWKKNFSGNHSMNSDNIEELESHLLDEIDHLKLKGLNEEEAFLIATKRMGTKDFLVSEFSKLSVFNTIVMRCMPFLKGMLFYFCIASLISVLGKVSILSKEYFNLNLGTTNLISVSIFVLVLATIAYVVFNNLRKGEAVFKWFNNIPMLIAGVVSLRVIDILFNPLITRQVPLEELGMSMKNIAMFNIYVIILILLVSLMFYFKSRQIYKRSIALK